MNKGQLNDMSIFVEVARLNGFRAAAGKLNLGAGSVSEAVRRLEDRLGVRLFERTTRKIALTVQGAKLYQRSLPAILELEDAIDDLGRTSEEIHGTLKLSAPYSCGTFFLDQMLASFAIKHPDIKVELVYQDEKVDLVSTGIDAAIRSQTLLEQDTHAIQIGPELELKVVASPLYLAKGVIPQTPKDLIEHDGICFVFGNATRLVPWTFQGPEGTYIVMPKPRMVVNNIESMLTYARAGLGVTYVYAKAVQQLIDSGRLISLFEGEVPSLPRYSINYLSKRNMPARLRAFIEFAKKNPT